MRTTHALAVSAATPAQTRIATAGPMARGHAAFGMPMKAGARQAADGINQAGGPPSSARISLKG